LDDVPPFFGVLQLDVVDDFMVKLLVVRVNLLVPLISALLFNYFLELQGVLENLANSVKGRKNYLFQVPVYQ